MNFTPDENELLLYAVNDLITRRRLSNNPLPPGFYALLDRLASFVDETKSCATQTHSPLSVMEDLVDSTEAAAILGCSPQYVGRIRDRLGVREIGSQRVFPRQTVNEYAARKAGQHK
ncbi:hypothetical protein BOH72_11190 [Mycobacterium sp. WY10]|nr:hypothetical protein BOH72_11190 [Mycobacterium sp. WY10]